MILVLLLLCSLLAVYLVARYRHYDVLRDWQGLLSPESAATLEAVEEHAALDRQMAGDSWNRAYAAQERDELSEALRLLELAWWVIEEATPGRLQRLRSMAQIFRQVSAVLPLPAIRPSMFQLRLVWATAGLGAVLHALLVAPAQRLILRVYVLIAGFRLAVWTMRRAKSDVALRPRAWETFGRGWADWSTLDVAGLETYRAAMMALEAELRREVA